MGVAGQHDPSWPRMSNSIAVYFGCWKEPGHYLWKPGSRLYRHEQAALAIPTSIDLDGSHLFLPSPEKVGTGCLTYLPAMDRTVLAWWGSPWDKRPAVNSAFITNGNANESIAWLRFCHYFPELTEVIARPTLIGNE